jgi:hypothetical protein
VPLRGARDLGRLRGALAARRVDHRGQRGVIELRREARRERGHRSEVLRQALHLGAAVTGPVVRDNESGAIEVPPGLTEAAARAFPDADAGSFDSEGTVALRVISGRVVLLHRGVEQVFTGGQGLLLRRLDVLRVPVAATLGHTVVGEIAVAAGAEITAWNASGLLRPDQRELVAQMVAAIAGPGSEPRVTVEAMLPFAYPWIRADYIHTSRETTRLLMQHFDGE